MRRFRVGTISMGITLIAFGIILLVSQVDRMFAVQQIMKWWPVILIILGIETLAYVYMSKEEEAKVKYDIFSIFIVGLIIFASLGIYTVTSVFDEVDFKTMFHEHYKIDRNNK